MSEQVDPRFFEQIMELKDSKYSIKIWHPSHFQHMHLNEFDQKSFKLVPNYLQYLQKNVQSGIALSMLRYVGIGSSSCWGCRRLASS